MMTNLDPTGEGVAEEGAILATGTKDEEDVAVLVACRCCLVAEHRPPAQAGGAAPAVIGAMGGHSACEQGLEFGLEFA